MDTAVVALLDKTGMRLETVLSPVLQDEVAAGMQEVMGENLIRKGFQAFQGVGRVGEDKVELLVADGEKVKDIVREANSKAIEPVPPNRSRTFRSSNSYSLSRILNRPSLAKSVVGRAL